MIRLETLDTLMTSDSLKGTPTRKQKHNGIPRSSTQNSRNSSSSAGNSQLSMKPKSLNAASGRQAKHRKCFRLFGPFHAEFLSSPRDDLSTFFMQFDSSLYISYVSCSYLSCSWTIETKLCRRSDYTMASGPLYSCRDSPCIEKTRKLKITS